MGHNDHLEDDHPDLPAAAGRDTPSGFETDDDWFASADPELQREAMRRWFRSRFWDPANDTPYNSAEGGYLYIHGGPYTAEDELYSRFGDLCGDEVIRDAIDDIESDGIEEWAPIHCEPEHDYDPRFALALEEASEPLRKLQERIEQSKKVLTLKGNAESVSLAQKLFFCSIVGLLETFLCETAYYWREKDEPALRGLVTGLPAFRQEKMPVADLFKRHERIKDHVRGYLQNLVWHRWDKVAQVFKHALSVQLPSTRPFEAALFKRHDIVHRSGHDKTGAPIAVTADEIANLCREVEEFAVELDSRIADRSIDLSSADEPTPNET
jgi:hypothetical protein